MLKAKTKREGRLVRSAGFGLSDLLFILSLVMGFYVLIGTVAASLYVRATAHRVAEMQAVIDGAVGEAASLCPSAPEGDLPVRVFDEPAQVHYICQPVGGNLWRIDLSLAYRGLTVSRTAYRVVGS